MLFLVFLSTWLQVCQTSVLRVWVLDFLICEVSYTSECAPISQMMMNRLCCCWLLATNSLSSHTVLSCGCHASITSPRCEKQSRSCLPPLLLEKYSTACSEHFSFTLAPLADRCCYIVTGEEDIDLYSENDKLLIAHLLLLCPACVLSTLHLNTQSMWKWHRKGYLERNGGNRREKENASEHLSFSGSWIFNMLH